jgi:hypothetical protein
MEKSNITCIQWILNHNNNNNNFLMMSTLLTLAFLMVSFIYFLESIQIVPANAQENNQQSQGKQTREQIIQQGIVTSTPDPLPGHEAHQSITILRLKEGNPTYQGTLTFTASKPVEVQILHRNMTQSTGNATAAATAAVPTIPPDFGTMSILPLPGGNGQVVSSLVLPQYPEEATSFSASLPFAGNGLALHDLEGDEFVATYTVVADVVGSPQRADDIAIAAPENQANEEEEEEEEEDGDEEDN